MCMSRTDFSLEWNEKEKAFVGYGWKKISKETTNKYKRDWQTAKFQTGGGKTENDNVEYSYDGKVYPPGFHIFKDRTDALLYSGERLVKVMYKDVLALGANDTGACSQGDCVIARRMKIVEKYSQDGTKKAR